MRTQRHTGFSFTRAAWLACWLMGAALPAAGQGADTVAGQLAAPAAVPTASAPAPGASAPALMRWHDGLHTGAQQGVAATLVVEPPAPEPAADSAPVIFWPGTDAADALSFAAPLPSPSPQQQQQQPSTPQTATPATLAPPASLASPPPSAAAPAQPPALAPVPARPSAPMRLYTTPPVDATPGQAHLSAPSRPALGLHATGRELGRGVASWYGPGFHGRLTANGERFDMNAMTAAHKTLPFGTRVLVQNTRTGKQVVVRINDRGPFVKGRIIDLSRAAASALGLKARGHDKVVLHELPRETAGKPAKAAKAVKPARPSAKPPAKAKPRPARKSPARAPAS